MFYYDRDRSAPASAFGAGGFTAPIIDGSVGDPNSPVLTCSFPCANRQTARPRWITSLVRLLRSFRSIRIFTLLTLAVSDLESVPREVVTVWDKD